MKRVTWDDELPVAKLPDDPTWRENYCFDGYDAKNDIGYWLHLGRWSYDPSMWREQINVYLPDGTLLMRRSYGRREMDKSAAGACFSVTCEEPGASWRLRYRGPARPVTREELAKAPLIESHMPMLDFDLHFTSNYAIWDFASKPGSEIWMTQHYEQPGFVSGRITFDGKSYDMKAGAAFRDHSRGPRTFKGMVGSVWLHGVFEGGRAFAAIDMLVLTDGKPSRAPSSKAVIFENGRVYDAVCELPPYLDGTDFPAPSYKMRLTSELGVMDILAEPRRTVPHSTTERFESFDGVARGFAPIGTFEQGTVFTWNGQTAAGHTERATRIDGLKSPMAFWQELTKSS